MTATHTLIPLSAPNEWAAALRDVPHEFGHTWAYCDALSQTTGDQTYLYSFVDDQTKVVCPLIERQFEGYVDIATPPGFSGFVGLGDTAIFPEHWRAFTESRGYVCGYLGLNPSLPNALKFSGAISYNSIYALDLRPDIETILAGFDRNRRREIRSAGHTAGDLIEDRSRLTDFLIAEYGPFMERLGAVSSYTRSPETLRQWCELDNVLLVGAGTSGRINAVYAFAFTPSAGTCLLYVHSPGAGRHAAQLLWYGIQALKQRRVPLLNLGGGVRENDAIALAKQRLGSIRRPLEAVRQIYRPAVYTELCRTAGADGRADFFPAYRVRQTLAEMR